VLYLEKKEWSASSAVQFLAILILCVEHYIIYRSIEATSRYESLLACNEEHPVQQQKRHKY